MKVKITKSTKPQKSCLTCKYREFDIYGWVCNKHKKYFDNELYLYEMNEQKCKYHKRDSYYYLSNGADKYIEKEGLIFSYKKGKFEIKQGYIIDELFI